MVDNWQAYKEKNNKKDFTNSETYNSVGYSLTAFIGYTLLVKRKHLLFVWICVLTATDHNAKA